MKPTIALLALLPVSAFAGDWAVMSITEAGKVSLLKGLERSEAVQVARRLRMQSAGGLCPQNNRMYFVSEGHIQSVEMFRSNGTNFNYMEGVCK